MRHPVPTGLFPPAALLVVLALFAAACGAGTGNRDGAGARPSVTPPAVGFSGEVDDAPYIAYERVSYERLPKQRLEPAGEVRLPQQVRRIAAFKLRDSGANAIRFTDDAGSGWLAWQPTVVLQARREFARMRSSQPSQITTLGVDRVDWPDSCLGVRASSSTCAADVTPGFRIALRHGNATAYFHTDLRERVVHAPG
jgi:hypothetical protein